MTNISTALSSLGVTEWVLRGEPTSETEFNEMLNQRKTQLQTLLDAGRSARVYGVEDIEEGYE